MQDETLIKLKTLSLLLISDKRMCNEETFVG